MSSFLYDSIALRSQNNSHDTIMLGVPWPVGVIALIAVYGIECYSILFLADG